MPSAYDILFGGEATRRRRPASSGSAYDILFGQGPGSTGSQADSLSRSISNAQTRLRSVGQDVPQPESQGGLLSSILRVISAPGQFTAGAVRGIVRGENPLTSGVQGVRDQTSFSDVLGDLGVQNRLVKAIGGFAGDVLLDPLNLISFGGLGLAKGGLKLVRGAEMLGGAGKTLRLARIGARTLPEALQAASAEGKAATGVYDLLRSLRVPERAVAAQDRLAATRRILDPVGGLRIAGQTVLPGSAIRAGLESTGIPGAARAIGASPLAQALRKTFSTIPEGGTDQASLALRAITRKAEAARSKTAEETAKFVEQTADMFKTRAPGAAEGAAAGLPDPLKALSAAERKEITHATEAGRQLTDERLGPIQKAFQDNLEAIKKAEQKAGILPETVEQYVPHIRNFQVRLSPDEIGRLERTYNLKPGALKGINTEDPEAIARLLNPHANPREIAGKIEEINKAVGKEFFLEDSARILALRGANSIRSLNNKAMVDAVAARYGTPVTPENVSRLLAEGRKAYRITTSKSGFVSLDEVGPKELEALSAGMTAKVPSPAAAEQVAKAGNLTLPPQLAGAKPRYSFGKNQFNLDFASDIDKALYIVAQPRVSKADSAYMQFLRQALPGVADDEIRGLGRQMRSQIKRLAQITATGARGAPGRISVPRFSSETAPAAAAGAKSVADVIVALPPEYALHVNELNKAFFGDENMRQLLRYYDSIVNAWKGMATAVRPGFQLNNVLGNVWNNWLGGVRDPRAYATALDIQRGTFQGTIRGRTSAQIVQDMKSRGVIGTTFGQAELGSGPAQEVLRQLGDLRPGLNPFSPEFAPVRLGRNIGNALEENAKIAHYITKFAQTGNADLAAVSTKRYLFDYFDLTPVERNAFRRIIPFYTWCVPEDARVLTRRGWTHHKDLQPGMEALTYNLEHDAWEWQAIQEIARFAYDGMLMHVKNDDVHFPFTPDHRWPVRDHNGERRIVSGYELRSNHALIQCAAHWGSGKDSVLTPREAALLGWIVTDGYHRARGNHHEMVIYQSPGKHLGEILELVGADGAPRPPHPETGVVAVAVHAQIANRLAAVCPSKADLPSVVTRLDRTAAEAMYDAMLKAEGNRALGRQQTHFAQKHTPVLEAFQILSIMLGRPANISARGCYVKTHRHIKVSGTLGTEWYRGIVWCPVTPNGTWVMERNGKVVVTGNTRKNLPLQLVEAAKQPGKFAVLAKGQRAAEVATGDQRVSETPTPDFFGNLLPFRVSRQGGRSTFLTPTIPAQDINFLAPGEFLLNVLGATTPAIRVPIELGTNRRFYQFPAQVFDRPGQTQEMLGTRVPKGVAYAVEQIPALRSLIRVAEAARKPSVENLLRGLSPVTTVTVDERKTRERQLAAYLRRLQDEIRNARDAGKQVPTMAELRKRAKTTGR